MAKQSPAVEMTEEQKRIEELAVGLAEEIRAKHGTLNKKGKLETSVEYVGVVYRDKEGTLRVTELHTINDTSKAPLGDAIKEAGHADRVVAVVHNHPETHVDKVTAENPGASESDQRKNNKLPSKDDWENAEKKFGDRTDVTYYLLTPDDRLLKYPYAERKDWDREREGDRFQKARGNYNPDFGQEVELPSKRRTQSDAQTQESNAPTPNQASPQNQALYAQATERQLPTMQQYSTEDQQRMCAHAVYLGAQRGWSGIEGVAPNNATPHHRAGEFLCVAGKSDSPDPAANGVAVPMSDALKAAPGEWLNKADTARQEYALTQSQAQSMQQTQDQAQSQGQNQTLTLSRS